MPSLPNQNLQETLSAGSARSCEAENKETVNWRMAVTWQHAPPLQRRSVVDTFPPSSLGRWQIPTEFGKLPAGFVQVWTEDRWIIPGVDEPDAPPAKVLHQLAIFFSSHVPRPDDLGVIDIGAIVNPSHPHFTTRRIMNENQMFIR